MTTATRPFRMRFAQSTLMSYFKKIATVKTAAFLILGCSLLGSLYFTSSASSSNKVSAKENPALLLVSKRQVAEKAKGGELSSLKALNSATLAPWSWESPLLLPVMQPSTAMVAIYAGDCSTPKSAFNVQDADKTVCAKVTGATPGWQLIWSNASFRAVQNTSITSTNQDISFTLSTTSSLGDWRVIAYEPFGGSVQQVTDFTVIDAQNPVVDLIVNNGVINSPVSPGAQVLFGIQVTNNGPSSAANVELTDAVPADTTFVSFAQLEGPVFNCTSPTAGSNSGSTVCTIASLDRGDKAIFLATYEVAGAAVGTEIFNTANVAGDTSDSSDENNSSTSIGTVGATPCTLTCPDSITVPTDSGQAGAVVTYSAPGSTGNCGQVTSNPASGSFFPVGTTTVISTGETGNACTFQVTVENPGGLSISLNGASPLSLQCGLDFDDPGATAVNGTGDPVAVEVSGTVDTHTPGSYTLTYTATQDPNSVSTTRTVNVSDSQAPVITLEGPNPMTVDTGQTFVDPGASANDACEGAKAVNSSGTVDTNTPGTYIITYTASDSQNHTATTTRTVIVESDPTAPPTITLNGDSQVTIECGTTFTDPGATATAPGGGSVPVTTSGVFDSHTPGTYIITYTACIEDSPGHCDPNRTSQTERAVTVEDTAAPTIEVHGDNPMTVECHTSFTDPGATAHDACAPDFASTAAGSVDANTVGQYTITYSATDPSGHAATSVTRVVNVVDTTLPVVTAPPPITVYTGAGTTSCNATVSDAALGTASANDSCQGTVGTSRSGVPSGNVFPVGTTTITYSATDASNNTGTATQTVAVIDNTPPTITAPADKTLYTGANATSCDVTVANLDDTLGTATANDNCPDVNVSRGGGNVFPLGETTVTYTATDEHGNTATASQKVTVVDNTPPIVTPPANITAQLPLNSPATSMVVNYPNPATATDNCAGAIAFSYSPVAGSTFPVGTTTVTVTATDAHNNSATATFTVTVLYNFTGFFTPVNNPPTLNVVNAGRAIPVKFSLSGNKGLNIFAADSPYTVGYNCGTGVESDVEETVTAGGSSLSYISGSDQYHYVWKTEGSWAGTCRQLVVKLNDGSVHTANFKFR